jgi:PleD family two-component response regulator
MLSHELKAPLAVIRMTDGSDLSQPTMRDRSIRAISEMTAIEHCVQACKLQRGLATSLSILVVDAHDEQREVTVAALIGMGHIVKGIACAEDIDEELGRFGPDLLLLDINLPGENGLSVASRLRAAEPSIATH